MPRRVAIVGYGVEGRASARYFQALGDDITICDVDTALPTVPNASMQLGREVYLTGLSNFDVIVRSPGIRPDDILAQSPGVEAKITSSTREFFDHCLVPIIGITGTKGKGTTSTLIARILEAAGRRVHLGGNIGRPAIDILAEIETEDIVVLELSSYQLLDLTRSPHIAVGLMIAPEHLNWHKDMDDYVMAKTRIFAYQTKTDLAVYNGRDNISTTMAQTSPGTKLPYGVEPGAYVKDKKIFYGHTMVMDTAEVGLRGPHNLDNICAAITATWDLISGNVEVLKATIAAFSGLPHRLEFIAMVKGVEYYDDSFATTPETAIAAIRSFEAPKVMILGGASKNSSFDELAAVIQHEGVIHTFLIGDTAPLIAAALTAVGFTHFTLGFISMAKLVQDCAAVTEPGDIVLLSPACASFGLFKDYKDRGDQFAFAVRSLTV